MIWNQVLFGLCGLTAIYGIIKSLTDKNGLATVLFIAAIAASVCWLVDTLGLFYHNIALMAVFTMGMIGLVMTTHTLKVNRKQSLIFVLMSLPLLLSIAFKLLRLGGSEFLRYSLVLTLIAWLYLFFDRKSFDAIWAGSTCIAMAGLVYLV